MSKRSDLNMQLRGLPTLWTDKGVVFTIWGNPLPKQSFRKGKNNYTLARIKAWQDTVGWVAKEAMIGHDIFEGALSVTITFIRGDKRRVDLDNLSKAVLDGCNKIVWKDDVQIKRLSKPRTSQPHLL